MQSFPGDGGEINQLDKNLQCPWYTPTRAEWPGLIDMAWYRTLTAYREKSQHLCREISGASHTRRFRSPTSHARV